MGDADIGGDNKYTILSALKRLYPTTGKEYTNTTELAVITCCMFALLGEVLAKTVIPPTAVYDTDDRCDVGDARELEKPTTSSVR